MEPTRFFRLVREIVSPQDLPDGTVPFVIVFLPRTGSNYLASLLDSHPAILCHHEVFNETSIHRSLAYKGTDVSFGTVAERDRDPWRFIGRIYAFTGGATAVGFKISPRQNDWALLSLLLNRRVRKVILNRRGWLHAYSSGLIAERTQVWSKQVGAGKKSSSGLPVRVRVDPAAFRRFVKKRRAFYTLIQLVLTTTRQGAFPIDYEDIGQADLMMRLLAFLGVDAHERLTAGTDKQNSPRLADRIENLEELRVAFAGTPFAELLDT